MVTLEQVEKLREKANISYEEAQAALEKTNGDILEAIINLEKERRIPRPEGGGYYSSEKRGAEYKGEEKPGGKPKKDDGVSLGELVGNFFCWIGKILNKGNRNTFDVKRKGADVISIPVTVLAVLLLFTFWITVPLIIVGLFFGYRYMFTGPDLGKENVNRTLDSMAQAAENIKKEVKEGKDGKSNGENSNH